MAVTGPITALSDGTLVIRIKAVPGARSAGFAGLLGDRLKVRLTQPPEGGKANDELRRLIAAALAVPLRQVSIASGQTQAQKTIHISPPAPAGVSLLLKRGP